MPPGTSYESDEASQLLTCKKDVEISVKWIGKRILARKADPEKFEGDLTNA